MPKIMFRSADGQSVLLDAMGGSTLMETATSNGVPGIEGECGGGLSCATCHVHIDAAFIDLLEPPLPNELELLEMVEARDEWSRLSCQVKVTTTLDGMVVNVPAKQGY